MSLKEINKTTMEYMLEGIRTVCKNFKRRAPGTQSERDAQAFFHEELKQFSDDVIMEDFDLHPHAFMGFIPIAAVFGIISIALFWMTPSWKPAIFIAFFLILAALLMFIFEFMLYLPFVDFLFPKRVSRNVYAVKKPSGELKRRIIFGGHVDAANEWTYSYHGGLPALSAVIGGSVIGLFILFISDSILAVKLLLSSQDFAISGAWRIIGIVQICLIPFMIAIMFFINYKIIVDGANDNLSASYIAIGVLKEMTDNGFRFENTEVGCMISGSEESGLRGARAFAKRHKDDLLSDVETIFISMDTMREIEQLQVYTRGCTGTVKNSDAVGDLLAEAGKNCGIDMPRAALYPGAVDAEAFSREGLLAAGFCGVNHDPKRYYHTREDTPDNMNPECIELSLRICMEATELYDKNGGIAKHEAKYKK